MGKSTVFVNGQGMSSANSGAITISGPDVCLTQVGPALVPVPYINTAKSTSIKDGTKTVKIDGGMGAIDGCRYSRSTGDEPGSGKGVASGTVGAQAEFVNYSFDVRFEGKGACRNADPMTHNNKNALGMNHDSSASPPAGDLKALPEKSTFRVRVVEHLSWDGYDPESKSFKPGHKDNRAIAGRKFKIRMADGSEIEKTTDGDGIIELTDKEASEQFEIIFVPENKQESSNYNLFYNRHTALEKKR